MNNIAEAKADMSNTKLKSDRVYLINTGASPSTANRPVLPPALRSPLPPNPILLFAALCNFPSLFFSLI